MEAEILTPPLNSLKPRIADVVAYTVVYPTPGSLSVGVLPTK